MAERWVLLVNYLYVPQRVLTQSRVDPEKCNHNYHKNLSKLAKCYFDAVPGH